jgi:hypothetical protein
MFVTARSITLGILVALLLGACGSSPPVRYFSLSAIDSVNGEEPDDAVLLGLGPLRVPEYLNRSQLVTRGAGAEMQVDEFSRWAEPLTPSLHRIVSINVDSLLDGVVVVTFPYESAIRTRVHYRVLGDINRFDAGPSGRVVLEIQWSIEEVGSELVGVPRRSRYEAQAATADDPAAIAEAMNQALALFSRDIAGELETLLQN